jgi:hypothetical protein
MILVRWPPRRLDADEPDDIRRGIGQRVKPVGQDADGAACVAVCDLRDGDREVEEENLQENAADGRKASTG